MTPGASHSTRLVLYSGLAADGRLFEPQRRGLPGVRVETPSWIEPAARDETLESYGRRMAALVAPRGPAERLFVGGVSFGAVVALEVGRHLPGCEAVLMIGGACDGRQVAPFFRFACAAAEWVPTPLLKAILYGAPGALVLFESLNWEHMRLYSRMVNDASPAQVRWSAGALRRYRSAGDPPGVRVRLIHGQRDLLIPRKAVRPDHVIPRGRHLVGLSRPEEVNAILLRAMGLAPAVTAPSPARVLVGSVPP